MRGDVPWERITRWLHIKDNFCRTVKTVSWRKKPAFNHSRSNCSKNHEKKSFPFSPRYLFTLHLAQPEFFSFYVHRLACKKREINYRRNTEYFPLNLSFRHCAALSCTVADSSQQRRGDELVREEEGIFNKWIFKLFPFLPHTHISAHAVEKRQSRAMNDER